MAETHQDQNLRQAIRTLEAKSAAYRDGLQMYLDANIELRTANTLLTSQIGDLQKELKEAALEHKDDQYALMTENAKLKDEITRLNCVVRTLDIELSSMVSNSNEAA